MSLVLEVNAVGKSFRKYRSELQRVATWFGFRARPAEEYHALRDVSFRIHRGESVALVGQNGAGKSTLLKLITGTLQPTQGSIKVAGRISAILELGLGFNADFTGRQNVLHAAGLMGYTREQIDAVMPDIEAFAEIGKYFDQPVRTYSSGMQMRVAFSVATAFRPDVLIVDEALSVGDSYFQHKSFRRIREFREQGTTLLIVSHDSSAVQAICDRAILLDAGSVLKDGAPDDVMDYYNALIAERENAVVTVEKHHSGREQVISGTREAVVERIELMGRSGAPVEVIDVGEPVELVIDVRCRAELDRLVLGYMIKDRLGQPVFGTNTHYTGQALDKVKDGDLVRYRIAFAANLGVGSYSVSTALVSTETHLVNNYEWRELALTFTVANLSHSTFIGSAWVPPKIEVLC